ncbi:FAD-dependent oxidoreductase [Amycolatopsis sp. YIM 10]|uniref:FAD-dependent oxidoreductase n=1 Tax=Amycolatopsis sp. YIM 10 TaxID=2653857 RepID=UPI00129070DF|nr:FAD/NAD(P)-binding oxidoreductase [Amycolatopsis sp. YIM 10]QFU89529.1 Rhodocoxin reductase [Amycolatopsis sp. YIM 10]
MDDTSYRTDWEDLRVELALGRRATGIADGELLTDQGALEFDVLLIATGARPRLLSRACSGDRAMALRTIDQARDLRARLGEGVRLVIIGAGWIGAEVPAQSRPVVRMNQDGAPSESGRRRAFATRSWFMASTFLVQDADCGVNTKGSTLGWTLLWPPTYSMSWPSGSR